jgi:hypothetical protein
MENIKIKEGMIGRKSEDKKMKEKEGKKRRAGNERRKHSNHTFYRLDHC